MKISYSLKALSTSIIIDVTNHKGRDCHFTKAFRAVLFPAVGYFKFLILFNEKEKKMFPVPSFLTCISVPLFSGAASNSETPKQDEPAHFHKLFPYCLQIEILRLVPPKYTRLSSQCCPYSTFHCDLKSLFAKPFPKYLPS